LGTYAGIAAPGLAVRSALLPKVFGADLRRARQIRSPRKDARSNVKGEQRPAQCGSYIGCRNAWADREMSVSQLHRAIHKGSALEEIRRLLERQNRPVETRRREIATVRENPKLGAFLCIDQNFRGRERRPTYDARRRSWCR
jgi:hypothetical protein